MSCSKESALEMLCAAHAAGRLSHAHLLTGAAGSGKTWVAHRLAARVLDCEPDAVLAHPDAHFLQPESKSRRIVIEQIRDLEAVIQRKPLLSSNKTAIIRDADRLQPAAANAFLKTLEEPPPGSILILTSSLPEALLETILSRCFHTPLHGGETQPGPEAELVLAAIEKTLLAEGPATVASAFHLTRSLQDILADIRERIAGEYSALLKQESAKYKAATGGSEWLDDREAQIKALAESTVLRERERLLGAFLLAFGGALAVRSGAASPHPVCNALAARFSHDNLLAKIDALHSMQHRLAMNVNEALALEAGMLDIVLADS
jgi:DNA polymerase III subunit delta'